MANSSTCPECGAPVGADAPEGLCPACLLKAGLEPRATTPSGPAAPLPAERVGALLPEYEVLELVGRGGMGAVYRARHRKLDRPVALKVLPPDIAGDPAFAERFVREARTTARLAHPGIVMLHDFGEVDGLYYLVLEFVEGRSLRARMREGMGANAAIDIVATVCEALHYAHERGVVHRDIKPENVLVDVTGRVRVTDFGLAKLATQQEVTLTGTQQVMGTPHYMAPEQIEQPGEVDHRADVYALGVVFYEMLTGQLPLGRFPPPSEKGAPKACDAVVLKALNRDPAARFASADAMGRALQGLKRPDVRPGRERPRPRAATEVSESDSCYRRITLAGGIVFVASFLPWVGVRVDFMGASETATGNAWETNLAILGVAFPNLLAVFAGIALAVLGVGSLAGWWRASWKAVGGTALYGLVHVLLFDALALAEERTVPQLGAAASLICFAFALSSTLALRPRPAPRASGRRARTRVERRRRKRAKEALRHAREDPAGAEPSKTDVDAS